MPQATDELRARMGTLVFLFGCGWTENRGHLSTAKARADITDKEFDCVEFLCDEWDFSYGGGAL